MKGIAAISLTLLAGCNPSQPGAVDPGRIGAPGARPDREAIEPSAAALAIVAQDDRTVDDRETDARRRPAELLTFLDVTNGQRLADLSAGSGYTTELLARAVGPEGKVWAQNDAVTLERFVSESWPARLEREVNANVVRVDREFDDPLPPEAANLDAVTMIFAYHDAVARGADVGAMNEKVFASLRPGGKFFVLDHAAPAGTGTQRTDALHRIDEATVVEQVTTAGFELGRQSNFLRDPADGLDKPVWEIDFVTDRFALEFVKP